MAVPWYGDFPEDATVYIPFNTFDSNDPSASVTVTDLADADIKVHKDGSVTQIVTDGATVAINFDSITGNHLITVDTSVHADYATGSDYLVRLEGITVDAATLNVWVGSFSIENRFGKSQISDIKSQLVVVASDVVVVVSDTTAIHSDTTIIASDVIVIDAAVSDVESSLVIVKSDIVVIDDFLDTEIATIASDIVLIYSDTTAIHSDTTIIASDVVLVYSDTAAIHSDTTIIASDVVVIDAAVSDVESSLVIVKSDLVIITSDTTAIHSDTTIIASDVVNIDGANLAALFNALVLTTATIETVTSQTQLAIPATADATDDDAYNDATAVLIDGSDPNQKSVRTVTDYDAGTRTITLDSAPDFTVTTSDTITLLAMPVSYSRINTELTDVLTVDTHAEPSQGAPPATTTLQIVAQQGQWRRFDGQALCRRC
jgi:hypothetical protein